MSTMRYKYVYGPVKSRRLGISLGVDIVPFKKCNFNCIYCQLGKTCKTLPARGSFYLVKDIIGEIKDAVKRFKKIDYISFSGSGEPTLNKDIGKILDSIKKFTKIPTAVLTNSSLLYMKNIREDLKRADVILPSLDSASEDIYQKINRPHRNIKLKDIIKGLIALSREFKGKIWLEIMLVKEINDQKEHLLRLKKLVEKIKPDKVQLNTVVRPPAEKWAKPMSLEEMELVKKIFGAKAEIISTEKSHHKELRRVNKGK